MGRRVGGKAGRMAHAASARCPIPGRARAAPRGQSPRGSAIDMNAHTAPDQPAFLNCLLAQRISLLARQNSLIRQKIPCSITQGIRLQVSEFTSRLEAKIAPDAKILQN